MSAGEVGSKELKWDESLRPRATCGICDICDISKIKLLFVFIYIN